jgi:hypothetical protein
MNIFLTVPQNGKILVKAGQKVDFETKLFEVKNQKTVKIDLQKSFIFLPKISFLILKNLLGKR